MQNSEVNKTFLLPNLETMAQHIRFPSMTVGHFITNLIRIMTREKTMVDGLFYFCIELIILPSVQCLPIDAVYNVD